MLVITAHAHTQIEAINLHTKGSGHLLPALDQCIEARQIPRRTNRHQPVDGQPRTVGGNGLGQIDQLGSRRQTALAFLPAGIDLQVDAQHLVCLGALVVLQTVHGIVQLDGQLLRCHGFHAGQFGQTDLLDEGRRLVGLERTDEVPRYVRRQFGRLGHELLGVVLPEGTLSGVVRIDEQFHRLGLANRHEPDAAPGPIAVLDLGVDFAPDVGEVGGDVDRGFAIGSTAGGRSEDGGGGTRQRRGAGGLGRHGVDRGGVHPTATSSTASATDTCCEMCGCGCGGGGAGAEGSPACTYRRGKGYRRK
mmetsp:Transcript_5690/g.15988  ORF Transcript_5690/g.15988 Transcript_5690/m.15988 type:complete len:305 (-) Transcript_5690:132-1046(-)